MRRYKYTALNLLNPSGRKVSLTFRKIQALFPDLRRSRVPCNVPADLGFLRYATMQAGAAVDCTYPLQGFVPTEGAYALTNCEEVLP